MATTPRLSRYGPAILWAVGGVLTLVHVVHLVDDAGGHTHSYASLVFATLGPLVASAAFLVATGWLLRTGVGRDYVAHLVRWTLAAVVVVGALGVLTVLYLRAEGIDLERWWYLVANAATGGAFVGLLVGVYDARAARTAARLRSERRRAEWLSQRLHVLNRVLRHDLRNEVNVVQGYASLIAEGEAEGADARRRAAVIERKSEEILRLSEKARQLEQLLAENEDVSSMRSDLAAVVRDSVDALRVDHPEAAVTVDLPEAAYVSSVPLLDAMVDDLVENAVVHNPSSEPSVSVEVRVRPDAVLLRVADDGPGIPDEELAVLDSGVETPLQHSNGLGLWFVRWVVAESGGRLDFEERPVGTVVTVSLPRASDPESGSDDAATTPHGDCGDGGSVAVSGADPDV
ncbi:sensor histidine kinase [Halopelagius longus]|uniref:histidine kinase n=1 Tax=Halopelagius longus TaxID=1236180 RepID=A0A1H1DMF0_9EURY|nr:ATP-binding protein [Halopelagius longus]RDI71394.1 histidine kinase [Halopelagius longus]SDQ77711.1 Signal transduction histidine kinase [Halopelagius longus]